MTDSSVLTKAVGDRGRSQAALLCLSLGACCRLLCSPPGDWDRFLDSPCGSRHGVGSSSLGMWQCGLYLCRVNCTGIRDSTVCQEDPGLGSQETWVLLLSRSPTLPGHYPPWTSVFPSVQWGLGDAWDNYILWCLARETGQSTAILPSKWLTWETKQ